MHKDAFVKKLRGNFFNRVVKLKILSLGICQIIERELIN